MIETREEHSGSIQAGVLIPFQIGVAAGKVIVSNTNNDDQAFSFQLLSLRRTPTGSDDDYAVMTPETPFDNEHNYQVLVAGNYALRSDQAADVIVTVEV